MAAAVNPVRTDLEAVLNSSLEVFRLEDKYLRTLRLSIGNSFFLIDFTS